MSISQRINNSDLIASITRTINPVTAGFVEIQNFSAQVMTYYDEKKMRPKAVKLNEEDNSWAPFSVLAVDRFGGLYMEEQFADEEFLK